MYKIYFLLVNNEIKFLFFSYFLGNKRYYLDNINNIKFRNNISCIFFTKVNCLIFFNYIF